MAMTDLSAAAWEALLAYVNDTPALLSILYDLDLLPEQVLDDAGGMDRLHLAATVFRRADSYAAARVAEVEAELHRVRPKADAYDRVCQSLGIDHDILGAVAARVAEERGRCVRIADAFAASRPLVRGYSDSPQLVQGRYEGAQNACRIVAERIRQRDAARSAPPEARDA